MPPSSSGFASPTSSERSTGRPSIGTASFGATLAGTSGVPHRAPRREGPGRLAGAHPARVRQGRSGTVAAPAAAGMVTTAFPPSLLPVAKASAHEPSVVHVRVLVRDATHDRRGPVRHGWSARVPSPPRRPARAPAEGGRPHVGHPRSRRPGRGRHREVPPDGAAIDTAARQFWKALGWVERSDVVLMSRAPAGRPES